MPLIYNGIFYLRNHLFKSGTLFSMLKKKMFLAFAGFVILIGLAAAIYQIPAIKNRLEWRLIVWSTYLNNTINPVSKMPTPLPSTPFATFTPALFTPTPIAIIPGAIMPSATSQPLPLQVSLPDPKYELQGINNCGSATLTMALRMYGWQGTQDDIAKIIKPVPQDRNVNPDELRYFVLHYAGWLRAEFRVAGNVNLLKQLLAANYPIIIEEASTLPPQDANGPGDDLWDAHYLLITGYDDNSRVFTAQDPLGDPSRAADEKIPYDKLMVDWKPFNYLYMVIYLPQDEAEVKSILGTNWDPDQDRQNALIIAQAAITADPNDKFAWFDLGSTLVYLEHYSEAAQAFDKAFALNLPQRMTRYQFQPFFAYYNVGRIDYLLQITEYTYKSISGEYSEEALLWHGYGLLSNGDTTGALADWNKALKVHPNYCDAEKAINTYIQPTYNLTNPPCSP
jgi:tetratricopeptide (TPR) repeat protein